MSSEFRDLEELEERIDQLAMASEGLKTPKVVPFDELFDASFISAHSNFTSFDEFLSVGDYHPSTPMELENILGRSFDEFISKMTDFSGWEEMFHEASMRYFTRILSS